MFTTPACWAWIGRTAFLLNNLTVRDLASFCETNGVTVVIEDSMVSRVCPCDLGIGGGGICA